MDPLVPYIHFEKQVGSLCAQHALNALLQADLFTAVDLADLARAIDSKERQTLAESGATDEDLAKWKNENYDDSGFFSSQVIEAALDVWGLHLMPWDSPDAASAREDPVNETAYICNLREHWFTLRRFGLVPPKRWYDCNSLMEQPKVISDTYLGMLIAQLKQDGYTIFVVRGSFPQCEADLRAGMLPEPPAAAYSSAPPVAPPARAPFGGAGYTLGGSGGGSREADLARQAASLLGGIAVPGLPPSEAVPAGTEMDEDEMLRAAIEASLRDTAAAGSVAQPEPSARPPAPPQPRTRIDSYLQEDDFADGDFEEDGEEEDEELAEDDESAALQAAVEESMREQGAQKGARARIDEEEEIRRAMQASLEDDKRKLADPDSPEELRRKRLARFGGSRGGSSEDSAE
ncbi:Josephin-domain-containing protein [Hyaloraphidium curvatum]|nr:Josephin-domain-containing protein [Hyaloraphidium curvatum]